MRCRNVGRRNFVGNFTCNEVTHINTTNSQCIILVAICEDMKMLDIFSSE